MCIVVCDCRAMLIGIAPGAAGPGHAQHARVLVSDLVSSEFFSLFLRVAPRSPIDVTQGDFPFRPTPSRALANRE